MGIVGHPTAEIAIRPLAVGAHPRHMRGGLYFRGSLPPKCPVVEAHSAPKVGGPIACSGQGTPIGTPNSRDPLGSFGGLPNMPSLGHPRRRTWGPYRMFRAWGEPKSGPITISSVLQRAGQDNEVSVACMTTPSRASITTTRECQGMYTSKSVFRRAVSMSTRGARRDAIRSQGPRRSPVHSWIPTPAAAWRLVCGGGRVGHLH